MVGAYSELLVGGYLAAIAALIAAEVKPDVDGGAQSSQLSKEYFNSLFKIFEEEFTPAAISFVARGGPALAFDFPLVLQSVARAAGKVKYVLQFGWRRIHIEWEAKSPNITDYTNGLLNAYRERMHLLQGRMFEKQVLEALEALVPDKAEEIELVDNVPADLTPYEEVARLLGVPLKVAAVAVESIVAHKVQPYLDMLEEAFSGEDELAFLAVASGILRQIKEKLISARVQNTQSPASQKGLAAWLVRKYPWLRWVDRKKLRHFFTTRRREEFNKEQEEIREKLSEVVKQRLARWLQAWRKALKRSILQEIRADVLADLQYGGSPSPSSRNKVVMEVLRMLYENGASQFKVGRSLERMVTDIVDAMLEIARSQAVFHKQQVQSGEGGSEGGALPKSRPPAKRKKGKPNPRRRPRGDDYWDA